MTSREVNVLLCSFVNKSAALDSMMFNSAPVKCPEVLCTIVGCRGSRARRSSARRYSFGIASLRRLRAIAAISLWFCPIVKLFSSLMALTMLNTAQTAGMTRASVVVDDGGVCIPHAKVNHYQSYP